jgi:uroporphyrinogen decarboxylase
MNGVERILAAVGHQQVDRPPVIVTTLQQGARRLGIPLSQYFGTPDRLAEGQLRLVEWLDLDAVFAIPHIVQDVLPWGAGIDIHEDGPPSVNRMVINRYEEIEALPVPDAASHPYLRHTLEAARALAARVKGERLILGAVIGPFSLPSMLMGTGKFLSLLVDYQKTHGKFYRMLMERMLAYTSGWARAQMEAGCDAVVFAEGIASASIVNEKLFLQFAKPVLEDFVRKTGGILALELVGHALPFLPHLRSLDAKIYLVGEDDPLPEARRLLGPSKALAGNLNNLKLLRWTPERVEFEARRAIKLGGRGFILANQAPEIPWDVPDANIEALVRAAQQTRYTN